MTDLKLDYSSFEKAINTLESALKFYESQKNAVDRSSGI